MITTLICSTKFRKKIDKFIVFIYFFEAIFYFFAMQQFRDILHNEIAETVMLGFLAYHAIMGGCLMNKYF
jgi:hypothetical protein